MTDENKPANRNRESRQEAWLRLRGMLKDVFAEEGGGEAYLRKEREGFYKRDDDESGSDHD
jgi:hypothetical protein